VADTQGVDLDRVTHKPEGGSSNRHTWCGFGRLSLMPLATHCKFTKLPFARDPPKTLRDLDAIPA